MQQPSHRLRSISEALLIAALVAVACLYATVSVGAGTVDLTSTRSVDLPGTPAGQSVQSSTRPEQFRVLFYWGLPVDSSSALISSRPAAQIEPRRDTLRIALHRYGPLYRRPPPLSL